MKMVSPISGKHRRVRVMPKRKIKKQFKRGLHPSEIIDDVRRMEKVFKKYGLVYKNPLDFMTSQKSK